MSDGIRHLIGVVPVGGGNRVVASMHQGNDLQEHLKRKLASQARKLLEQLNPPAAGLTHVKTQPVSCQEKRCVTRHMHKGPDPEKALTDRLPARLGHSLKSSIHLQHI